MPDTPDSRFIDKRTCDRYIRGGQLDEKSYEKYLKNLPDVESKATPVETVMTLEDSDATSPEGQADA